MDGNSDLAMGIRNRRVTMTMLDEQSWTVVQQWVMGRDVKQWRCWMNSHEQWFSNGYREETWNNDDVGWTVMNSGSAMGNGKRRETMTMLDKQSWTVVQQWVPGRDVKQWRCWMNSHEQWFSNGYREETWNNDDVGWTVTNSQPWLWHTLRGVL